MRISRVLSRPCPNGLSGTRRALPARSGRGAACGRDPCAARRGRCPRWHCWRRSVHGSGACSRRSRRRPCRWLCATARRCAARVVRIDGAAPREDAVIAPGDEPPETHLTLDLFDDAAVTAVAERTARWAADNGPSAQGRQDGQASAGPVAFVADDPSAAEVDPSDAAAITVAVLYTPAVLQKEGGDAARVRERTLPARCGTGAGPAPRALYPGRASLDARTPRGSAMRDEMS